MAVKALKKALAETRKMPLFTESLRKVKIGELKPAPHNPKSRTDMRSPKMRQTMRNIEDIGLIYPIAVDKHLNILDGHRRWTCCKELGWTEIPVIIVPNENANAVYAGVNANSEIMSGLQVLQVYLSQPEAVSNQARKSLERFEELFGRAIMRELVKAKMSYHTLSTAVRIARYVDDASHNMLMQATNWLIKHRSNRIVKSYMTLKQPPKKLWEMIRKDKNLELTFA